MADRKTVRLIEFEESDWLDLKTFYNSLSFKQRLYEFKRFTDGMLSKMDE